tara:strand:- start:3786 stop:4571 length:786 start_codon:yes stop_codon:yes gene_type:complete
MEHIEANPDRPHGPPDLAMPTLPMLRTALAAGWRDFIAAPTFGLVAAAACVLAGWTMVGITVVSGNTFWFVLAVFAFPMAAPFAAFGTYEVSRRRARGASTGFLDIVKVLWRERGGQLPWLNGLMVVVLLFWFFLGHMIFALFLGLKPMTNIMSSGEVFLSPNGLAMLAMGSLVGGSFALLFYAVCVIGLPMLLDREVDYVTAMIRSVGLVIDNPVPMLAWAALVAIVLFLGMLPGFLGLLVVLPWLGHASWHLYAGLKVG